MDMYKQYSILKVLHKKNGEPIATLVQSKNPSTDSPFKFVLKELKSPNIPLEANIHKKLASVSPHIVKYLDDWQEEKVFYMCIEYCSHGDIYNLQRTEKLNFPFPELINKFLQVALAVQTMHSSSYCHRDIKPLNIFVTESFDFKLGDFGIAKHVDKMDENHSINGTTPYMSPEMYARYKNNAICQSNPYRDDIWALGKSFYEISTGVYSSKWLEAQVIHSNIEKEFGRLQFPYEFEQLVKQMICQEMSQVFEIDQVVQALNNLNQKVNYDSVSRFHASPENATINLSSDEPRLFERKALEDVKEDVNENNESRFFGDDVDISGPSGQNYEDLLLTHYSVEVERLGEMKKSDGQVGDYEENLERIVESEKIEIAQKIKDNGQGREEINRVNEKKKKKEVDFEENKGRGPGRREKKAKKEKKKFEFGLQKEWSFGFSAITPELVKSGNGEEEKKEKRTEELRYVNEENIEKGSEELSKVFGEKLEKKLEKLCCVCKEIINEETSKLPCQHYHHRCFIKVFEPKLVKATKKIENLKCDECSKEISFEDISEINGFSPKASEHAYLQMMAHLEIDLCCPSKNCSEHTSKYLLSNKLNYYLIKCTKCRQSFCSFCCSQVGHIISCNILKDRKKAFYLTPKSSK